MIFIDKICQNITVYYTVQNIKSFVKQNDMLRIHSKPDRNWQDLTMCTTYMSGHEAVSTKKWWIAIFQVSAEKKCPTL